MNRRNSSERLALAIVLVTAALCPVQAADEIGRLTSAGTATARKHYEYDAHGRVIRTSYVYDGVRRDISVSHSYAHDAAATPGIGSIVKSRTYPDGEVISYDYNAGGAVTAATLPGGDVVRSIKRNARGQEREIVYGNGVVTTRVYDEGGDLRLQEISSRAGTSAPFQHYQYDYDENGNVRSAIDVVEPSLSASYEYDTLDELTRMRNGAGSLEESYAYDAAGNLTQKGGTAQTYGGAGRGPHALASAGIFEHLYDLNGNTTRITQGGTPVTEIDWNSENMAVRERTGGASFPIDIRKSFVGESLWKKVEGGHTFYYLPQSRVEDVQLRKFYDGWAERTPENGQLRFYHPDHLGSATVMTNDQGQVIRRAGYRPWGDDRAGEGVTPLQQFTRQEKESSGFYDYGARLYDPDTGRWLSADMRRSDGLNRYAYVRNNPLAFVDPDGHAGQLPEGYTAGMWITNGHFISWLWYDPKHRPDLSQICEGCRAVRPKEMVFQESETGRRAQMMSGGRIRYMVNGSWTKPTPYWNLVPSQGASFVVGLLMWAGPGGSDWNKFILERNHLANFWTTLGGQFTGTVIGGGVAGGAASRSLTSGPQTYFRGLRFGRDGITPIAIGSRGTLPAGHEPPVNVPWWTEELNEQAMSEVISNSFRTGRPIPIGVRGRWTIVEETQALSRGMKSTGTMLIPPGSP